LVDTRASNPDPTPIDTTKQDAKAFFFIQQAVHDTVFVKIAAEKAAKEAWIILKTAFQRSSKVVVIKLQGLRQEFETLNLKQDESVQSFLTRVTTIVNQIRSCGGNLFEKIIVMKVLLSFQPNSIIW
jgi:gag-polypeptide of LTR copia-type